jgi:hypothetical protein
MSPLELILSEIPDFEKSFVAPSARQKIQQYHSAAAETRRKEGVWRIPPRPRGKQKLV